MSSANPAAEFSIEVSQPALMNSLRLPLKAQAVPVRIGQGQLLHSVRGDPGLFDVEPFVAEMTIGAVHVRAPEEETCVRVAAEAARLRHRRTKFRLVGGVQHD